jgi:prepilin-type N-terminal cleavage/methylation domain-containing protein
MNTSKNTSKAFTLIELLVVIAIIGLLSSVVLASENVRSLIQNATDGSIEGLERMDRDPWGSPYYFDENEGEGGNCNNRDTIRTLGPDGVYNTGDELVISIPLSGLCD